MEQLYKRETTCAFTGHRYIPAELRGNLRNALQKAIAEHISRGVTTFISGGALGFDTLAAQCVLQAREKNADISLVMMLPCRDQSAHWGYADRLAYEELLKVADDIYFLNERYVTGCMHQRNKVMVKQSGYCIAYFDGKPGGTAHTVALAKEQGLKIQNLY